MAPRSAPHYGTGVRPCFLFSPVRTRLLKALESGAVGREKVLSIVAPIGYGKTVLMSQLYETRCGSGETCLWIGLGHRDMQLEQVIRQVDAALPRQRDTPAPAESLLNGDEIIEHAIDRLAAAIGHLDSPSTVFIDNLNSCEDVRLGLLLDALIFRTPPHIRFVWSSTAMPAIDRGRAKLAGLLHEIGAASLHMDCDEISAMLGADVAGSIGDEGVHVIQRRTEGWPAGIRMMQIALGDTDRPRTMLDEFSGSDENVAAMLSQQLLAGFSADLCDFLLSLALLNTFSTALCAHLFGPQRARRHLDYVLSRNVFVIPLDRNQNRYRFHGLFREFLLAETQRQFSHQKQCEVFRRAAEWCQRNQEWEDTIHYALKAEDFDQASRVLDRTSTLFVRDRGDIHQYARWIEQILPTGVPIGWEAHLWYIWTLVFQRRFGEGMKQQELLAERIRSHVGEEEAPPADLPHRLDHLSSIIDLYTDRLDDAYRRLETWLDTVRTCDSYNIGSAFCIKAITLTAAFRFAEARRAMHQAEHFLAESGGPYTMGWVVLTNGMIALYEGDLPAACKLIGDGLQRARETLGNESILCGMLAFAKAKCAVEMGFDDEARDLLLSGLRVAHMHGLVDTASFGIETAAKLCDGEDGPISLDRLREIAGHYPPRLSQMLNCYLVQRLLRLGHGDEAFALAERVGLESRAPCADPGPERKLAPRYRDLLAATTIDMMIASGQLRQAEAKIDGELRLAQQEGRYARVVELHLSRMSVALCTGNPALAAKAFSAAINLAARRRIVRPFVDHLDLIAALVDDTKPASWIFIREEERKFFAEICASLPVSDGLMHDMQAGWCKDSMPLVMPTRKEAELLSLLDLGLSNQQIAEYSNISITTVKWHLKNLYRKFGVPNRSAALARARSMRLLSQ